jgi:hypothetical protein
MKTTVKENNALDDETLILLKEWCQDNKSSRPIPDFPDGRMKSRNVRDFVRIQKLGSVADGRFPKSALPLGA